MVHENEDLPWPRTLHLGQGSAPWISYEQQQQQQQQQRQQQQQNIPMTRQPSALSQHQQHYSDLPPHVTFNNGGEIRHSKSNPVLEDDAASVTSFKTCPSDPNLMANLLPRQVTDNYDEISRLHRSRDTSVLSGASEVTLSPGKGSKRPSFQSEAAGARVSGAGTPIAHTRPRLKETDN